MTDGQANTAKNIQDFRPQVSGYGIPVHEYEDEISLVDLWLVLVRRKKVIAAVIALVMAAGVAFAFSKPEAFQYSTSIEIGSRSVGHDIRPIDNPETVLAKIKENYIPLVLKQYADEHSDDHSAYQIATRIPKQSEIIVLEGKGTEDKKGIYLALLHAVVTRVREDHQRIGKILRKVMEGRRNQAVNQLAGLRDQKKLLQAESERLGETADLLRKQIEDTKKLLSESQRSRDEAVKHVNDEARAMMLLMLDSEVRATRELLAKLEERFHIELASKHDKLSKDIADNRREQSGKQDEVATIDTELANFRETRAVVPPMQSLEPVGPGKPLIIALSVVLGVFLGIFAAFFAEFLAKVREQTNKTAA